MQGTCVEQVDQVARLKRLPLTERGRSHPPPHSTAPSALKTPSHGLECKSKQNLLGGAGSSHRASRVVIEPVVCVAMLVSSVHKAFWGGAA